MKKHERKEESYEKKEKMGKKGGKMEGHIGKSLHKEKK